MNDYQFKLVKIKGEFVKHQHTDTDEVFIVIEGKTPLGSTNITLHYAAAKGL